MEEKQTMQKVTAVFKKLLDGENRVKLMILLGVLGVVFILISEFAPKRAKPQEGMQQVALTGSAYEQQLEDKIYALITSIEGVGRAKVLVTLQSGIEYIYASEEKKTTDVTQDYSDSGVKKLHQKGNSENSYILVDNGSGKEALVKTQIEPTVKGVVVVCEGAENAAVEERVLHAVTTALAVSSTQVCISKMAAQK